MFFWSVRTTLTYERTRTVIRLSRPKPFPRPHPQPFRPPTQVPSQASSVENKSTSPKDGHAKVFLSHFLREQITIHHTHSPYIASVSYLGTIGLLVTSSIFKQRHVRNRRAWRGVRAKTVRNSHQVLSILGSWKGSGLVPTRTSL